MWSSWFESCEVTCARISNLMSHRNSKISGICCSNGIVGTCGNCDLGCGLLNQFAPFPYFPIFSALSKHRLTMIYYVDIWQVSPQLSCGDICQIWTWFKISNLLFWYNEISRNREINERSFSNPFPWLDQYRSNHIHGSSGPMHM